MKNEEKKHPIVINHPELRSGKSLSGKIWAISMFVAGHRVLVVSRKSQKEISKKDLTWKRNHNF